MSVAERLTGLSWRANAPIALIGLGHASTHWVGATFYIMLPAISLAFGLTYTQTGALVSIVQISSFAANLVGGPLTDMTGRRVVIQLVALGFGGTALAVMGVADGFPVIAAMAAVIGATQTLWHPPSIAFLASRYAKHRGYALSIHALGASAGDTAAPLVAGALMAVMAWQAAAIAAVLPVLVITALVALFLLPTERPARQGGQPARGLSGSEYLTGMLMIVRSRGVLGLCVTSGFRSMTQNGLKVFLPLYLIDVMAVGPAVMGATIALMQAAGLVATPLAGIWSDRVGRRRVVLVCLTVSTVMTASLTFLGNDMVFIAGVSLLGFTLFAVRPVVQSWLMDITPAGLGGSATSFMFAIQTAFAILMPLAGGAIADRWGLTAVFYVMAATILLSNVITLALPNPADRPLPDREPAGP